jgi:Peptidase propeptide and YPEB domain
MKRFLITKLIVAGFTLSALGTVAAQDLTADQVKTRLEAAGYTNVQNIRREGNHFDAKATKDGKQVSLDIDAKTGAIKPEEGEDEEDERK